MKRRYRAIVAYDGTDYAGWQIQPAAVTVQGELERVLASLTAERVRVHGSGRTDSGVHARAQVAHFDLCGSRRPVALRRGMNALLGPGIRIVSVRPVSADFHARFSAVGKEYRYRIWDGPVVPPFLARYRAAVRPRLDLDAMRRAAELLQGRHDFSSFAANPKRPVEDPVRRLSLLQVARHGHDLTIRACADGFLYRMVRSLAGFLVRVGRGEVDASEASALLESSERTARVPTAPPEGLFLWRVSYRDGGR